MFFQETQINDLTKCQKCQETFNDPRLLPCGETICLSCVQPTMTTSNEDNKQWLAECPFCSKKHFVLENEDNFPPNRMAARLIKKKPQPVIRSKDEETLRERLTKIEELISQFEQGPEYRVENIAEYCQSLRNQVDKRVEELKHEIDLEGQRYRERIDAFEADCVNYYREQMKNEDVRNKLNGIVEEARSMHSSRMEFLSQAKIDESKLIEANKELLQYLQKVGSDHDQLLSVRNRDEQKLEFKLSKEKRLDVDILGSLRLIKRKPVAAQHPSE
jgi:hypothetical protein